MTISSETLLHYVNQVSNSSCPKEPMPPSLFKTASLHFCDSLLSLINMTVRSTRFPENLKKGFVVPLIKKPSLDPENLNNYRPVTNLLFLSKMLELVLFEQLKTYLEVNSLYGKFQSAYRRRHSTETALTRISNDLLGYLDSGFSPLYVGLDLSAAFDSIDHHLLLRVLEMRLGVRSDALKMLESYLIGRTQCVYLDGVFSDESDVLYGVPQGSILGPVLFCCYLLPLEDLLLQRNIGFHMYADDTVLYFLFTSQQNFDDTMNQITTFFSSFRLKLNKDKSEFLWLKKPDKGTVTVPPLSIPCETGLSSSVKLLGVQFDQNLLMEKQINRVVSSCFFNLRKIFSVKHHLERTILIELIRMQVISRLDYCNILYVSLPTKLISKLQRVVNVAARCIFCLHAGTPTSAYIRQLHWLPIKQRCLFKLLLFVHRAIHKPSDSPLYLQELLKRNTPVTRMNYAYNLEVPKTRSAYGRRSFRYIGPTEWNKLPASLKSIPTELCFRKALKTYLF